MRDLTQGSVLRHLFGMAAFIGFGLLVQTLYVLIDLYFVAHLGEHAVAGVAAAGSAMFAAMAATQLIGVGALSLISQAVGRRDQAEGQSVLEQSASMSVFAALLTLLLGYSLGGQGVSALAADPIAAANARTYLFAFLPSLATLFISGAIGAALRATGVVAVPMIIQSATLGLNILLAPILIAGWGTGLPLGVAGAGLASSLAGVAGVILLAAMFNRMQAYLRLPVAGLRPRWAVWRRIASLGVPASGEFLLMFVILGVVYWSIRSFGAEAQAGFGIGSRVTQAMFLPVMAVAFAASPIAGQNYGAGQMRRVRATFGYTAAIGSGIMFALTLICQIWPEMLVRLFTQEQPVVAVAAAYLGIVSWNFVSVGLVLACSGMFQALGNTLPSLLSSASRLVTFVVPAVWLSYRSDASLVDFWHLSVLSVTLQAALSLILLRAELRRKLGPAPVDL